MNLSKDEEKLVRAALAAVGERRNLHIAFSDNDCRVALTLYDRLAAEHWGDPPAHGYTPMSEGPTPLPRSERVLRTAILDVLTTPPHCDGDTVGARLRRALNESREPSEHPEDRCEECRQTFAPWDASPEDWERVTSRNWGGPILCKPCFDARLALAAPGREDEGGGK